MVQWLRLLLPMRVGGGFHAPEIPHASCRKKENIKQEQYCNKFNKDFKNVHAKKRKEKLFRKITSAQARGWEKAL